MAKEEAKRKKCPTAEKRMKQNLKQRALTRSFKSSVRTAINAFEKALSTGEKSKVQATLSTVYSLMDKGVKRGVYKKNKAARVKSNVSAALREKTA